MSDFKLRDAEAQDKDAIREVTLAAYEQYATVMPDFAWTRYRQNILETLAAPGPAEQIVAERNGEILGTVLLYTGGTEIHAPDGLTVVFDFPEVRLLAVPPAARGQGVGQQLMRECLARARRAGMAELHLHTTDMMQVAMQMYERMGFVRAPEFDFFPAPDFVVKGYRYVFAE